LLESSAWVSNHSSHVLVDSARIEKVVDSIGPIPKMEWDFEGIRYFDNGPPTIQYLFALDALNFCFSPDKDLSYDHLAFGLKAALQNDKSLFSCWFVVLVFLELVLSLFRWNFVQFSDLYSFTFTYSSKK
jgi:hypothetical protein